MDKYFKLTPEQITRVKGLVQLRVLCAIIAYCNSGQIRGEFKGPGRILVGFIKKQFGHDLTPHKLNRAIRELADMGLIEAKSAKTNGWVIVMPELVDNRPPGDRNSDQAGLFDKPKSNGSMDHTGSEQSTLQGPNNRPYRVRSYNKEPSNKPIKNLEKSGHPQKRVVELPIERGPRSGEGVQPVGDILNKHKGRIGV